MSRRSSRVALFTSLATLCASAGCTTSATAVVVVMDTNIPTLRPMELTVRIADSDSATNWRSQLWSRGVTARPDTLEFPSSFTVMPKRGADQNTAVVWFDVNALPWTNSNDALRFTRRMRFAFTPGQTTRVRVFLAAECGARATDCPASMPNCTIADRCEARGLTCGEGGACIAPTSEPIPFDYDAQFFFPEASASSDAGPESSVASDAGIDGSMDAGMDGAAPQDAGRDVAPVPDGCMPICAGRECGGDNCGGTCGSCAPRPNMVPSCDAAGQCQYTCAAGFGECDGMGANGCETPLNSNSNCGACGRACSGTTPICSGATCGSGCGAGLTRCGMSCVDTNTDEANCGACGRACSLANATAVCTAGGCAIGSCNPGFANCDGNAANGCETPLGTASNCGSCGAACSGASPVCNAMTGMCASGCAGGQVRCGMSCVDTATDINHCGACGNACPARANSTASCSASSCRYTCNAGFGDCDGNTANGCETPLTSTSHCGMCGRSCSYANGSAACNAGSCALAGCTTGFGNCDGNASNGCETPLNSTTHCGGCGVGCSVSNGAATCASGSCQVASCSAGFGNCDGSPANGCETNTTNNGSHCGACGNACPGRANASSYCSGSACGFTCSAGFGDCNSSGADGCEVNTTNNVSHCGGCGAACPARTATNVSCSGSSCSYTCTAGNGNCDGNITNGCETPLTTTSNCGGCGVGCSRTNATATCASGSCAIGSCNAGFGNCDGNDANGCETPLTSSSNCGGCGVTCNTGQSCIGGFCDCAGGTGCGSNRRCCEWDPGTCACTICVCNTCACP
ncbi:MAG: hypothetical protein U0269_28520 [Polyangiales bacterium]